MNPNCDDQRCLFDEGEVRLLPLGGGANLNLCRYCFEHEMNYRRERNRDLAPDCRFKIIAWEKLKVPMKTRFIICHVDPHNYGSHITWRSTLKKAKAVADAHANEGKIGVWNSTTDKYVYTVGETK